MATSTSAAPVRAGSRRWLPYFESTGATGPGHPWWLIALTLVCVGAGWLTAKMGFASLAVAAGFILVGLVILPMTKASVAVTTALLVVLPDSPTLGHVGSFELTPRICMLCAIGLQWTVTLMRQRATLRLTFPVAWALYVAVVIAGALAAGRIQAVPLFVFLAVLPYGVGCTLGGDARLLRAAILGLVTGALILSVMAITEFIRHQAFYAPVHENVSAYVRAGNLQANAGWTHPLALGMFLCLVGFLVIDEARRRGVFFATPAAILVGAAIFSTQERSPLVGLIVGAFVYVIAQLKGRKRRRTMALAAVTVVAVFAAPGPSGSAFRQFLGASTMSGTNAAIDVRDRGEIVRLGVHAVGARPAVGFGYGTLANVAGNTSLTPLLTSHTLYTDVADWPLTIAIETGLVGLSAFFVIVIANFRRLAAARKSDHPLPAIAVLAGLIAALVTSIGVSQEASSLTFLFVLGIGSTGARIAQSDVQSMVSTSNRLVPDPRIDRR